MDTIAYLPRKKQNKMIAETDLIIKNNNIYHIDVNKDNVAETIILVGDPSRVEMVSKYFDTIRHKSQHREFVVHTGTYRGKELSVISTGIGPDNIDIVINELDTIFNVDLKTREVKKELTSLNLIRLGTCGTIREEIPVNSIICSDYAIGLDNLMSFYKGSKQFYDIVGFPEQKLKGRVKYLHNYDVYLVEGDNNLKDLFNEIIHGGTVTSPGFYAPQGRSLRIENNTANLISGLQNVNYEGLGIINFEMETSALYGLAKLGGHKAITLCTVVANRETKNFSKNAEEAVDNMIRYFLEKIKDYE